MMKYLLWSMLLVVGLTSCSTKSELNPVYEMHSIENLMVLQENETVSIHWDSIAATSEYRVGIGLPFDSAWNAVKSDPELLSMLPALEENDKLGGWATVNDTSIVLGDHFPGQVYEVYIYGFDNTSGRNNSMGEVRAELAGTTIQLAGQWEKEMNEAAFVGWKFRQDGTCIQYSTNKKTGSDHEWTGKSIHYIINEAGNQILLFSVSDPTRQQFSFSQDATVLMIDNVSYAKL